MAKKDLAAAILWLFVLTPSGAWAQTLGANVRGVVEDESGHRLGNARLTLVNEDTGERRQALSGAQGRYVMTVVPAGSYRMEAELTGYRKSVHKGVRVHVGQEIQLDLRLERGRQGEEVVVTAAVPMMNIYSPGVGVLINNRQISGLPLDGRNFLQLSLLVPGTAPSAPGSPGSVRGEFSVNVNGAREDANNFLLDGVYNGDPKLNSVALNPPVDGILEFEILTSTYDASFGRSGGAQVNVAMKSGTNELHGTAYEFLRNASLDARNFFARSEDGTPQYQRNQFGFSLGGPVVKNRTFFFVDYEGRRAREGITRVANVPTELERAGDFSASSFAMPADPFTGRPFPQGRIPETRISGPGRAVASLFPSPNRAVPGGNYVSSPTLRDRDDRFDLRLDHSLGYTSLLVARYSFSDRDLFEPFSGATFARVPGFGTRVPRRAQNFMIGENHTLSAGMINELRFGYNRVAGGAFHENQGTSINRQVGLPEISSDPRDFGLSFITVSGYSPLGDEFNNPQHSVTNTFQVVDNVTYARRNHLVKFGFDFRALQQNAYRDVQSRGFLSFVDQAGITGNALADLLLGFPYLTGGARLDNAQHLRTESWNLFLQDNVRVRPNLSILLGVRYEYNSPPVDRFDRANVFDSASGSLLAVGAGGVPRSGYEADRNNWGPRAGIAWSPGGSDRFVLHGGYGVYFDQSSLAPGEGLYFNPPYFDFNLYFSLPGLPLTLSNPFPSFFPLPLPWSVLGFQRNLRTAYVQQWNFKVQHQIDPYRLVELGYVGSKGTKLLTARDINQPRPAAIRPNLRPDPRYDDITFEESRGSSSFHSMQFRFEQRFHRGSSILAAYTWAKSLDDTSTFFSSSGDPNFPQDSLNVGAEKGRSNFDIRHRMSFSYACELPFGRGRRILSSHGWLSSLIGGWTVQEIVTLQTGRPFTVALHPDIDQSNTGRSILGFGFNDRPVRLSPGRLDHPKPERWFDTSAFGLPSFGSFGDSGRNILDGPGFNDFSFSMTKESNLSEGVKFQFRTEFFNFFNRPSFDLPDIFLASPTFGQVLSAQSPRRIQFGLKLLF